MKISQNFVAFLECMNFTNTYFFLGTPDGGSGGAMSMTIFLNRHTGFNRSCRVRFNMRVAEGIESGIRDEVSDQDGKSLGTGQLISEHIFPDNIRPKSQ